MKKIISIFLFSVLLVSVSFGQTRKAYIKAAEEAMLNKSYYEALTFYNEALDFKENDPEILFKSAEAAREFHAYEMASQKYSKLIDTLENKEYPSSYIHIGSVLLKQGEYERAREYLNTYISEYSDEDEDLTKLAQDELATAKWAEERISNPDKSAELEQFGPEVNSNYSDFGGTVFNDVLYFSTMKHEEEGLKKKVPRSISKIHTFDGTESHLIENDLNADNSLKANPSFSPDGKRVYYTICDYDIYNAISCEIYSREVLEDGEFGEKKKLPGSINLSGTTSTQPNIGYDAVKDREILYFVSDREGGKGGYDIYYSVFNSMGDLSEPINLDEINTNYDDVTPFLDTKSNRLYYSTQGLKGLGGFDIYSVDINDYSIEPEHIPAPVNSSYDDLYYTWDDDNEVSYFSSNRASSAKVDELTKACCFDIYKVTYNDVVIELNAMTFDSLTRRELKGATVIVVDKMTGDTIDVVENMEGNGHEFILKREKEYTITSTREHYDDYAVDLSTKEISESTKINKELYMYTPKTQIDIFAFNNKTKEELIGTRLIIRNLTDGSFETIDLTNLEGNDYHVYLDNGHKYEVEMSKFGFVTKNEPIDLTEISEPTILERKIYLDVFEIEEYKNTAVFFENDYPNPRSRSIDTDERYGEHYTDYLENKGKYLTKLEKNKKVVDKEKAYADVENFFSNDVMEGYVMFEKFMRALKKELELGRKLEVQLKGYASPVADSRYNKALSQRRVNSVKNEMLDFENGFFRDYLGARKLIITDVSFGEERAPADVSDSSSDISESVYSVKAARERRVEIIKVSDQ